MSSIKHIFFDFNGTLINDVDLCLELLNGLLKDQNKKEVTLEEYKNIFTFPIEEYYRRAGIDFNIETFQSLSLKFITKYQPRSLNCGLYPKVYETINRLREMGYHTYILSASEKNNLIEQCNHYKLLNLFDDILGIDDINARSKVDIAINYCEKNNINSDEVLFVGDTLHDYEVSKAINAKCYLVSCGHQSKEVLSEANVPILKNIYNLLEEL